MIDRHIWEDGSTHRAVCGDEYDRVCDIADTLLEALGATKGEDAIALIARACHPDCMIEVEDFVARLKSQNATLLEALETIAKRLRNEPHYVQKDMVKIADEAIRKAKEK